MFGICFAILYVVCDMAALPMFTYHPGTDRIDPGFAPPRRTKARRCTGMAGSPIPRSARPSSACSPPLLPEKIRGKIPLALAWIVPVVLLPVLIYSLKFYWRWE